MTARTKIRWLMMPLLAVSTYGLFSRQLVAGSFWSGFLAQSVIYVLVIAYFILAYPIIEKLARSSKGPPPLPRKLSISVEDRLDELERLKRRDMVTPEEYAAKRQDILKDL